VGQISANLCAIQHLHIIALLALYEYYAQMFASIYMYVNSCKHTLKHPHTHICNGFAPLWLWHIN